MEFNYIRYMENLGWDDMREQNLMARYEEDKKRRVEEGISPHLAELKENGWTDEQLAEVVGALKESAV